MVYNEQKFENHSIELEMTGNTAVFYACVRLDNKSSDFSSLQTNYRYLLEMEKGSFQILTDETYGNLLITLINRIVQVIHTHVSKFYFLCPGPHIFLK